MSNDNSKIIRYPGYSKLDYATREVLRHMTEKGFDHVVVIGKYDNGSIHWDAPYAKPENINWLLDSVKADLFDQCR